VTVPPKRRRHFLATFGCRSELVAIKHSAAESDPLIYNDNGFTDEQANQSGCHQQYWHERNEHNAGNNDVEGSFTKSAKCDVRVGAPTYARAEGSQFPDLTIAFPHRSTSHR
jgi:hypothetical protein